MKKLVESKFIFLFFCFVAFFKTEAQNLAKAGFFSGGSEINDIAWDFGSSSLFIATYATSDSIDVDPRFNVTNRIVGNNGNWKQAIIQCDSNFNPLNLWQYNDTSGVIIYSLNSFYGDLWVTGYFNNKANLDIKNGTAPVQSANPWNSNVGFIARYSNQMDYKGSYIFGSEAVSGVEPWELAPDGNGGVYCSGLVFSDSTDFPSQNGTYWLAKNDAWNSFVLRIDSTMNLNWAKLLNGKTQIWAMEVIDSALFIGGVGRDVNGIGALNVNSNGSYDIILSGVSISGTPLFYTNIGGSSYDLLFSMSKTASGKILIAGRFNGQVEFNPLGSSASFQYGADHDAFIATYNPSGTLNWVKTFANQGTNRTIYAKQVSGSELMSAQLFDEDYISSGDTAIAKPGKSAYGIFTHDLNGNVTSMFSIDSCAGNIGTIVSVPNGAILRLMTGVPFALKLNDGTTLEPDSTEYLAGSSSGNLLLRFSNFQGVDIEERIGNELFLYPNPADDYIYVNGIKGENFFCTIYNNNGALVFSELVQSTNGISIQDLSNGNYYLHIEDEGLIKVIPLVIQH